MSGMQWVEGIQCSVCHSVHMAFPTAGGCAEAEQPGCMETGFVNDPEVILSGLVFV